MPRSDVAQIDLGFCYENGTGVDNNEQEATRWYRLAADQGYAVAQYKMGHCYEYSTGVDINKQGSLVSSGC
jgi:TPR repeat protein